MYKLTNDINIIVRLTDNTFIPRGHRLWADYEQWLAKGNTPEPADVPEPVYSISPESKILPVGGTMVLTITGATGDYAITVNDAPHDVTIDESGIEEIELPATDAGAYIIKGLGLLSECMAKVEVY